MQDADEKKALKLIKQMKQAQFPFDLKLLPNSGL